MALDCASACQLNQGKINADTTTWIDVGTAAQSMMLCAHELGLGTCPTTSFSRSALQVLLKLPDTLIPEFIIQIGHPQPRTMRSGASLRLTIDDLTYWENYPK